ncbi:MAG: cytochrome c [Planctomycetia bacterium]|nr:cytochrome c [Planctomycetia bacterium]
MKTLAYVLAVCLLTLGLPLLDSRAQEQPKVQREKSDPKQVKELMRKKLDHAQKVLEGIAVNDPDLIAKHADGLIQVSKEAAWRLYRTPQYDMNSEDFRRSAEKLVRQAKAKDLESAKLTYLEMTMTCFHCHRYVRDVGMVRLDLEADGR